MTLKQQLKIAMAYQLASRVVEAENICDKIWSSWTRYTCCAWFARNRTEIEAKKLLS